MILTSLGRPGTLRRALDAKVGGFLLKDAPADKLAKAVRDVAAGRRVVDNELVAKMKTSGIKVNDPDKDAFIAASKGVYEEFGKEVAGGGALVDKAVGLGKGL